MRPFLIVQSRELSRGPNVTFIYAQLLKSGMADIVLLSGTAHPSLAQEIADHLSLPLGEMVIRRFPDGEIDVELLEGVRGKEVFVLQPIALDPNEYLVELLIIVDALKRASAKGITAVIPYYGYCRQDRRDKPRVAITAKLVADLLSQAGVSHLLTMDLHAGQLEGFFDIPVDNLHGRVQLIEAVKALQLDNCVVVAPDIGSIKIARLFSSELSFDFAIVDKQRCSATQVEVLTLIGNVEGKNVLLADDMCSTAGTLVSAANACHGKGARKVFAACTHGLFVGKAVEKLEKSLIELVIVTNTIPATKRLEGSTKIRTVSVASPFAWAIRCIASAESFSFL